MTNQSKRNTKLWRSYWFLTNEEQRSNDQTMMIKYNERVGKVYMMYELEKINYGKRHYVLESHRNYITTFLNDISSVLISNIINFSLLILVAKMSGEIPCYSIQDG